MNSEDIIQEYSKKYKIPSISVGLVSKNNTQFFNYGEIKKESEIDPTFNTLYEIGSMTKTFTTILTAQLENEGLLSLDDPIIKFLPEFAGSDFDKNKITLYHLLTHTSGISEFSINIMISQIFSIVLTGKSRISEYEYNTEKFLDYISKLKLKNSSGSVFRYSNIGLGLVGKILERITNSSYENLVKNRIFDVLDMKDSGINIFETHKDKLATGYTTRNSRADYWNMPAIEGAGSLRSTTSDIVKFLKANLGLSDTKLLPILEKCQTTKSEPKIPSSMKFFTKAMGVTLSTFRLGWFAFPQIGKDVIGHDGGTEGFTSFMGINPKNQTGVVVLTNRALKPAHKLGEILLKEMDEKRK